MCIRTQKHLNPIKTTQREVGLRKRHVFLIEKYVEDVRQDEKHVPDLLEPIMRLKLFVKEELW